MQYILAILRLPYIGFVLGRAGVLGHLGRLAPLPAWQKSLFKFVNFLIAGRNSKKNAGEALCIALQRLGPVFIKFGQALSTRADLLGPDIARGLVSLQDSLPAFSSRLAKQVIEKETGKRIDQIFVFFDEVPIAAASVAQVHKAQLIDGRDVAVKVLRPHIHKKMATDIALFGALARIIEFLAPRVRRLRLVVAVEQFKQLSEIELDMRMEAAAGRKLRDNLAEDHGIHIPWVEQSLTSENILVSEWITGLRIDDVDGLKAAGHNIDKVTEQAATSFFNQVFRDGYFHADMHPGNIFITSDGTLVPIDFGIMGNLQSEDRFFLGSLLLALLERDYDKVALLHLNAGMLPETTSLALFAQNLRALVDPIMDKPIGEIELSAALGQILQISSRFDIFMQPQFNLLQKTMVMAEGVARSLNPQANMWHLAKPLASEWIQAQTGFTLKIQQILTDIEHTLRILPKFLAEYEHTQKEKQNQLRPRKINFISNLGWLIAGIAITIAFIQF